MLKQWIRGKILSLFSQSTCTLDERRVQSKLLLWKKKLILVILFHKRYTVHCRKDSMWLTKEQKSSKQVTGDTERTLPCLVCWLASLLSSPAQIKMQMVSSAESFSKAKSEFWITSHPYLLLWGGLKLLLRQTSHRLCQQPDQDQRATGFCRCQRNVSILPALVLTGRSVGPTIKRALGPKAVY